jgi:hypothetical protein
MWVEGSIPFTRSIDYQALTLPVFPKFPQIQFFRFFSRIFLPQTIGFPRSR